MITREEITVAVEFRGIQIRRMTLRDFIILEAQKSPFITKARLPELPDVAQFLWILTPEVARWHDQIGWRKPWIIPTWERIQAYLFGRHIRKIYSLDLALKCFEFMDSTFQRSSDEKYISCLAKEWRSPYLHSKSAAHQIFRMPVQKLLSRRKSIVPETFSKN